MKFIELWILNPLKTSRGHWEALVCGLEFFGSIDHFWLFC